MKKNPRRSKDLLPSEYARPIIESIPATMAKNKLAEPKFVKFLKECLKDEGEIEYETCLADGAYIADCSQITAERYLKKHSSQFGPFHVVMDDNEMRFVRLRAETKKEEK
jgi:hypothetical protein